MLRDLMQSLKKRTYSLRFCILSIFIIFSIILLISLRQLTHYFFMDSMTSLSYQLMQQASLTVYHEIIDDLRNAEVKNKSSALLVKKDVVSSKDQSQIVKYTNTLLHDEALLLPRIQAVYWADIYGSFIVSYKEPNGSVTSEIINRSSVPFYHQFKIRNSEGLVIKQINSEDFSHDPRTSSWYQAAENAKKTIWTDVYQYAPTHFLGVTLATPVYDYQENFMGVVGFDIPLYYLQNFIEDINATLTENGIIFIVRDDGKLIAYPKLTQTNTELLDIKTLSADGWIIASFEKYSATHSNKFTFSYRKQNYLATYQPLFHFGSHEWMIVVIIPEKDFIGKLVHIHFLSMTFAFSLLMLGIICMSALITKIIRPLKEVTDEIEKIKNFDLSSSNYHPTRITEINSIEDELDSMKKSLRSFQKYVPAELVRELIDTGEDARIGGTKKPLVIFFSDIKNFTSIAEHTEPTQLTKQLCEYFEELSSIIASNHGTIDKYIGDSIMAFWGAPHHVDNASTHAAKAALECIKCVDQLNVKWSENHLPQFITRIGVHLGDAIVGNLGSAQRLNYTAIGDAINLTSRLEGINKIYGTKIIISEEMYQTIKNQFVTRLVDIVILKGRFSPSRIYELVAIDPTKASYDVIEYNTIFAKAFHAYQNRQWDEAIHYFTICKKIYSNDNIAPLYIERCEKYKANPPPANWDGVWRITE